MLKITRHLKQIADNCNGNVTVELALVMSIFALVMVGGYDFSNMAVEKHRLEQIARAGTQWGLLNQGAAVDHTRLEEVTLSAAGNDAPDLTVDIANFCECPDDGSTVNCDSTCAGGVPDLFLTITVTKDFVYLFQLSEDYGAVTLEGSSTVRVR